MRKTASRLNITLIGVGAMGTLFGSRLHPLANVSLLGSWPAQLAALKQHGVQITDRHGKQASYALQITADINVIPPADFVFILVKSYQTRQAAAQAARILRPNGMVVTLQNGLGNLELLAAAVGAQRAASGITAQGATVTAPGQLYHAGEGPTYIAATKTHHARLQPLITLLNKAGIPTQVVTDADSLVWGKLAINAGINPLTALLNVPNGALVKDETLRLVMSAAAREVAQVAAARGIPLPYSDAAAQVAIVSEATGSNRSSMLQDVSRHAPTEIDVISGAVVKLGREAGVPTPINQLLLELVQANTDKDSALRALTRVVSGQQARSLPFYRDSRLHAAGVA
jgi:2-dehydropantoate 2-reductase